MAQNPAPIYRSKLTLTDTSATSALIAGGMTIGTGAVALVDTTGKIPALSSTYFASLSGANLTALPAGQLTGTITPATQDLITRTGTLVSGATGAGFTIALSTSTVTGTLANARTTATSANVNNAIVARDAGGNFSAGTVTALLTGDVTGNVSGNAGTATALQTARTIAGVSFNGTANISIASTNLSDTANLARLDATALSFTQLNTVTQQAQASNNAVYALKAAPSGGFASYVAHYIDNAQKWQVGAGIVGGATYVWQNVTNSLTAMALTELGALSVTSSITGASFIPTSSSVPTNGLYLSAANTLAFAANSTLAASLVVGIFTVAGGAFGTGAVGGPILGASYNSSGNGAPGCVGLQAKNGAAYFIWVDSSGKVRVGTSQPTETSGDTIGTIVGTQS